MLFLTHNSYQIKPYLLRNLAEQRYENPTAIQMQSIPCLMSDREILVCAPTGSGKTLSFALPILHRLQVLPTCIYHYQKPKKEQTRAVVVCPTKELAKQTQRVFSELAKGKPWKILLTTKSVVHYPDFASSKNGMFWFCWFYIFQDVVVTTPMFLLEMVKNGSTKLTKYYF